MSEGEVDLLGALQASFERDWRTWAEGSTEPPSVGPQIVTTVRDASGIVSYADSPEWVRIIGVISGTARWSGFKGGERVILTWDELLAQYGPVTGVVRARGAA